MALAEEKLGPRKATLYFMAGNDDLYSIDDVIGEFKTIRNPDKARFEIDGDYEIVGLSNANMTPWACARDIEEDELTRKLDALAGLIRIRNAPSPCCTCHLSGRDWTPVQTWIRI
jgi:Icc-related predicted phosphoesterase